MITISCPKCDSHFRVEEKYMGLSVKCKSCGEPFGIEEKNIVRSELQLVNEPEPENNSTQEEQISQNQHGETTNSPTQVNTISSPPQQLDNTNQNSEPQQLASQQFHNEPLTTPSKTEAHLPQQEQELTHQLESKPLISEAHLPRSSQLAQNLRNQVPQEDIPKTAITSNFRSFADVGESGTKNEKYEYTAFEKSLLPAPGWKKAIGILSWIIFALGALILIFGSLKNGFLTNTGHDQRFIIAGFISFVGTLCFFFGAKRRSSGLSISAILTITLLVLAFYLPIYATPARGAVEDVKTYSIGPLKNPPKAPY